MGTGRSSNAAASRRGPTAVGAGIAALLLFMAIFARGGLEHAAEAVARPSGESDGMVRDLHALGVIVIAIAVAASVVTLLLGRRLSRSLRDEDRLRARAAHDQRLAALGQMSAVLAHELRNPLASLKGNAQLLVEVMAEGDRHRAKAERVVAEALRLEKLTNELLEFVRTGGLRTARASVGDVVVAAADEVGAARIRVDVAPDVGQSLIDAPRLRMAVENVLRNAVDGSGVETVTVSVAREKGDVVVSVRDRGAGIVAGEEETIFEPFFTRKNHGTGLGLAVTRRIVELHGGTVVASNHPEGGAVFRMAIPSER